MQNVTIKPFGVEVNWKTPENLAEMITLAGGGAAGEAVIAELANKQYIYHTAFGAIRAKVVEAIEKTGLKRKVYHKKTQEVTPVTTKDEAGVETTVYNDAKGKVVKDPIISFETENNFIKRICAEQGVEPSHYITEIQAAADAVPYDLTVRERTAAEKKIAAVYLATAEQIVSNGAAETVAAKLGKLLGRVIDVSDSATAQEVLARAISDNEARERAQTKSKYLDMAG